MALKNIFIILIKMIISITLATIISVLWVRGIDHMKTNHPDYDGKDLFNE